MTDHDDETMIEFEERTTALALAISAAHAATQAAAVLWEELPEVDQDRWLL